MINQTNEEERHDSRQREREREIINHAKTERRYKPKHAARINQADGKERYENELREGES